MGLRPKILLTFIICFGLMAGISLTLLQRSMADSYDAIERRDVLAHMTRVQQVIEARLAALNTTAGDWSTWTDMYQFARQPDAAWAKTNIGPDAMAPADLSLFMLYGQAGQLLTLQSRDADGEPLALPTLQASPFVAFFKKATLKPGCGLMPSDAGVMLTCWSRVLRSDGTGGFVGNIVMGRLFDASLVVRMSEQVALPFELHSSTALPPGLTPWLGASANGPLGTRDFLTTHEPNIYHLYYPLQDLLGQGIGLITLDVSRDVHLQGERLFERVRREQLWVAVGLALLLFAGVHFSLVHRLRKFEQQLLELADKSTWDTRIKIRGKDELGALAHRVNQLLTLIQSQVRELHALSLTDPLTGLANRRAFDTTLAHEHSRELRSGKALALLLIDVDQFKPYNDRYGHPAGDQALKELAKILQSSIRHQPDMAARIGGEEFAVLLPDTNAQGALQTAQRIRANLFEKNIAHAASSVAPQLTVSIGLAVVRDETPQAFMNRADRALYQAKDNGRDNVHCAD